MHTAVGNFRVPRALRSLEATFTDPTLCLRSVAAIVDVTPPHLDRLLKAETGLTFLQHLRRLRIAHAEILLLTTAASLKEIAYACGYRSRGNFGRDFRRVHRGPARAWRAARAQADVEVVLARVHAALVSVGFRPMGLESR